MKWPWVSRPRFDEMYASFKYARHVQDQIWKDLLRERRETRRLTEVIVQMRRDGFNLGPEHTDEKWPGGKYNMMDEADDPSPEESKEVPVMSPAETLDMDSDEVLAAQIEADMRRAFPDG